MNYIYDIYINLNKTLYDFFDWNKNDKITHIKKIPIFRLDIDDFINFVNYNIKVSDEFLNCIKNSTETWSCKEKINNCALFCDINSIIAIEFNDEGVSIRKSYLMIEEEAEVLEDINIRQIHLNYKILNKTNTLLKTRKELKEEVFIKKELKNIDNDKLNYIYFECFGKKESDKQTKINKLSKIKSDSKVYKNLYDILKLTSITKN